MDIDIQRYETDIAYRQGVDDVRSTINEAIKGIIANDPQVKEIQAELDRLTSVLNESRKAAEAIKQLISLAQNSATHDKALIIWLSELAARQDALIRGLTSNPFQSA